MILSAVARQTATRGVRLNQCRHSADHKQVLQEVPEERFMKIIIKMMLALTIVLAFADQFDNLRGRRELSPWDWQRWIQYRADVLRRHDLETGDVA